jgi:hypothetical protein
MEKRTREMTPVERAEITKRITMRGVSQKWTDFIDFRSNPV